MTELLFVVLGIYTILSLLFFTLTIKKDKELKPENYPFISVVIAVRNEENNIFRCLESLNNQSYPKQHYEVIVVDDHSIDNTSHLCKEYVDRYENFHYFELPAADSGKRKSLIYGIDKSKGDIIFNTDADCTVNEKWIDSLVAYLNNDYVIAGGFTLINYGKKVVEKVQALDWIYLLSVGTALSRLNNIYSLFGNNSAYKKRTYLKTGGYRKVKNEILIDYQLAQLLLKDKKNKGIQLMNTNSTAYTMPYKKWKDYIRQKKRWAIGTSSINTGGKIILLLSFLTNLFILISPVITKYFYLILILKFVSDILLLLNPLRIFKKLKLIPYCFIYEIFYTISIVVLGFLTPFLKSVSWKERNIKQNGKYF